MISSEVAVPGGLLRVVLHGPGGTRPPVLALHDLDGSARRWDAVASRLAAWGHPVAAVDLRGHGASADVAVADLGVLAADVAAVAAHLGWWPVVVGHGFGAAVALRVAADHPALARVHVWVAGGTTELAGRFADWPTAAAASSAGGFQVGDPARAERLVRLGHPDWDELAVQGVLADVPLSAIDHRYYLLQLWEQRPSALYPQVTAPVVVVAATAPDGGSTTRWAGVEAAEIAAASAGLLRVRVEHIAGDEDLPSDRPDEVAAAIAGAAIDPPGSAVAGA